MMHDFPYTDLHELNLDWFLGQFKDIEKRIADLKRMIVNAPDATGIEAGLVPTSTGDNKWSWKDPENITKPNLQKSLITTQRNGTICGDTDHYLQGGCYVDSIKHYILAFSPAISSVKTTILVELDLDFSTVINRSESVNYGHCNDLTYNPDTDQIFASSTGHEDESLYKGKVVIIDPHTLNIIGHVDNITNLVSAISYDPVNKTYYTSETVGEERQIFKYDSNFDIIENLGNAYIIDPDHQVGQSSFCYKGKFYLSSESNLAGHHVWINTFGTDPIIYKYDNFAYYETESLITMGDKIYLLSIKMHDYIYVYELSTAEEYYNYENEYYMRGSVIQKNTSLNKLTQTGRYYETDTSAATITGTPYAMTGEFTVDVLHLGYNKIMQVLTDNRNEIYTRIYDTTWHSWRSVGGYSPHTGSNITDSELDSITYACKYSGYLDNSTYFGGSYWIIMETVHLTTTTERYLQIVISKDFIGVRLYTGSWNTWKIYS